MRLRLAILPAVILALGLCPLRAQDGVDLTAAVEPDKPAAPAISLEDRDGVAADKLGAIYRAIPAFSGVEVAVNGGVVTLTGRAPSAADARDAEEVAQRLDGTVFVLNQIETPDSLTAELNPALERLRKRAGSLVGLAPLLVFALVVVVAFWVLARLLANWDGLYARLFQSKMLRGIASQVTASLVILIGVLLALELLDATALVGAVFGAAGLVGLALGFAFRDIAENYLASLILGVRRPFATGDLINIDGHEGRVIRLTTRETILMTVDGNHVRLPNAKVFKAVIMNYTRNSKRRFDFAVGMGLTEDLMRVQELGLATLNQCPGVLADPPAFAAIEELGDSAVAVRFYAWMDQDQTDFLRTRSEAMRRVKTRMDDAGVDMPIPAYQVQMVPAATPGSPAPAKEPTAEEPPPASVDESLTPRDELGPQIADSEKGSREENLLDDEPR